MRLFRGIESGESFRVLLPSVSLSHLVRLGSATGRVVCHCGLLMIHYRLSCIRTRELGLTAARFITVQRARRTATGEPIRQYVDKLAGQIPQTTPEALLEPERKPTTNQAVLAKGDGSSKPGYQLQAQNCYTVRSHGWPMSILDDFDSKLPLFRQYSTKLDLLLAELLSAEHIRVHSVTTRVKERASFEHKLNRIPAKYATLDKITDLCGARIITYFADEVQTVAALIENEFDIDRLNSVDWRQTTQFDRFGYLSVHYVATLLSG
jgi:hypothetical protein